MRRKGWWLAVFILMGSFSTTYAQEILAKGVLLDYGTKNRIVLAEILNQRTGYAVGSNDMGFFQIKAAMGDTLLVSKRGYPTIKVVVHSTEDIIVKMQVDVNNIGEVVIQGQNKRAELDDIKKDFKDKGSFYSGKPPLLSFFFRPLTALYELFGRTPKNARRFGKYYDTEIKQQRIDQLFSPTKVRENTGLEGKELSKFMFDYRPSYEMSKQWAMYDAVKYIRDSYKKYSDTVGKKLKE